MFGYSAASRAQARQCVTAWRLSSKPASASRNAPVHTEQTRRACRASFRTALICDGAALFLQTARSLDTRAGVIPATMM